MCGQDRDKGSPRQVLRSTNSVGRRSSGNRRGRGKSYLKWRIQSDVPGVESGTVENRVDVFMNRSRYGVTRSGDSEVL